MRLLRYLKELPGRIAIAAAPLLRFLAALFLLLAIVLFVAGSTQQGTHTSTLAHWQSISPSSLASLKAAVTQRFGAWMWDPLLSSLLGLPSYVLFGGLALLCGIAGRRRRVVNIFVN
ncbi:MAG: hypothetical protein H6876_07285 [Hyphomicrobiaceae bacterium]|nr:hypothetical protein [Hyphomicrobiaceae bacterium]MCC0007911.1 hypothetical protein [Hyphomicrobiaceae bacterium]